MKNEIKTDLLMKYPNFDLLNVRLEHMKQDLTYSYEFSNVSSHTGKKEKKCRWISIKQHYCTKWKH